MGGLGPADADGNYRRPVSDHLNNDAPDRAELEGRDEHERPLLIVGRSCPWAHRAWLVHRLRRLEGRLNLLMATADHRGGRWVLSPAWNGCHSLLDLYRHCNAPPSHRATVPVLVDPIRPQILCNDSAPMVDVLNQWPAEETAPDLNPSELHEPIATWQDLLQPAVNDGVYRCGFARNQAAFDRAESALFAALEQVESSLRTGGPWLCGERLTLADVRLFPTLIRWDTVYAPLFGCSRQPLWQFPQLWDWRRRFFDHPGVKETCDAVAWRQDYFGALFPLNPGGIVPSAPELTRLVTSRIPQ
jgi:putative glutathione S-transferase